MFILFLIDYTCKIMQHFPENFDKKLYYFMRFPGFVVRGYPLLFFF